MAANYRIIRKVFNWTADYLRSLCMWMKCMIGSLMDSEQKQPQRVTFEEECQKTYVQADKSTREDLMSEDTVDLSTNYSVIEALESVSEAIYTKCISSWHCPPEDKKEQPLFKELNGGICGIYFNIKAKVRPLEEYDILIAVANSVINHLKNFRKKRETHKNYTPKEEVDFLRKQTHSLLSYWLPDSLRNSDFILVFLKEIISINVLQPSINMLADPTFINETIVRTLGGEEVNKKKDLKLGSASIEPCASTCILESDCATNRKKKKNKIFRKIKGLVTRTNSKKHEEHGDNSRFRSYSGTENEDTFDCTDGFTEQISSDEFGEDEPVSTVNETILQKWEEENWTARICENPTKDRPTYKICVSKDGAKLWITERSVKDFKQINSIICEKYPDLEAFTNLEQNEEEELEDSDFFQVHGTDPDTFINALLKVIKHHHDPEPIFFFSPFNYEEEVRELFSIVFLDNELSQEDISGPESETEEESDEKSDLSESDGFKMLSMKRKKKSKNKSKHGSGSELEDTCGQEISPITNSSEVNASPLIKKEDATHRMTGLRIHGYKAKIRDATKSSKNPSSVSTALSREREEEENKQKKKQEEFFDSLIHLADELFAGGRSIFRFLQKTGFLKEKSKDIIAALPQLYAEDQIVWYLNQTSELLLAQTPPLEVSPDRLPSMAQELLKSSFQGLLTNAVVKYLFEKNILNSITACHEAFQKLESNKETVFRIFEDLTRVITKGS